MNKRYEQKILKLKIEFVKEVKDTFKNNTRAVSWDQLNTAVFI